MHPAGRPTRVSGGHLALWGVAWLAGAAAQLMQPALWPQAAYAGLAGVALAAAGLLAWLRTPGSSRGAAAMVALALGALAFLTTGLRASWRMADALPASLEGRDLVLVGVVASLPRAGPNGLRFEFDVEQAWRDGTPVTVPRRVSLGWFRPAVDGGAAERTPDAPDSPDAPDAPDAPDSPDSPDSPESPESPESPDSPGTPVTPVTPGMPGTPAAPLAVSPAPPPDAIPTGPPAASTFEAPAAPPDADATPRAGERWRLPVRLRQPHGVLNPHGFDLELWLFERGLRASGSVRLRSSGEVARLGHAPGYFVARWRQQLRDRIAAQVGDARRAGVVAALAVGDQGAVDRDDWALFRATGVIHLMAISGLHVTMFAWLAAAVVGRAWRGSAALMRWLPAPQAARWGGLALAAGYAVMAGWGVPAQRTLAMLAVVVGLRALGLRWPAGWVLGAAALAVTLGDPWALLQPGFWLSFVAVALLMGALPAGLREPAAPGRFGGLGRLGEAVRAGLRTQAVATLGLTPLTLLFFQQVSVVGFVANLVAIPLVTLLITPLALAGAVWAPLWSAAAAGVDLLAALLAPMAAWPWAVWTAPAAPPWAVAAGLLGGALAVLPGPWRLRALGLPLLLPLLAPAPSLPPTGRFELVAVDVGQGTAVLLRTRSHLLVYDAGPAWGEGADAGDRVLRPLLQARGERRIDRLLLSHPDADHVGGAASLLAQLPVRRLTSTLPGEHPLRALGVPHEACAAGLAWRWDGVSFEVLHPEPGGAGMAGTATRPNATSCVLRVEDAAGASVLLTGDIEAAQEVALVLGRGQALRSDVLMVPHHGSRTSSTGAFLDAVAPHTAFVQAAYRSRFGHPAPDVLARYTGRSIRVVRSDRCGAWTWTGDGPGVCERERRQRYWHHRG